MVENEGLMGRICSLVLVSILVSSVFMILMPIHSVAAEPVRVYFDPSTIVDPSTFFNVSAKVDSVQDLAGIQLWLTWDPSLLHAVNMTDVVFHETVPQSESDNIWRLQNNIDNFAGTARYAYTYINLTRALELGYCPFSGNFTIFVILFQVRRVGNCTLHFTSSKLGDPLGDPIAHDTIDGSFTNSIPPPSIPPSSPNDEQIKCYADPGRIKNESLTVNSTFSISVKYDNINNSRGVLAGLYFLLEWNSTILECINATEVMLHEATPLSEWFNIGTEATVDNIRGHLGFATWFLDEPRAVSQGYDPVFGNHTIVILTFRVKGSGESMLILHDFNAHDGLDNLLLYAVVGGLFANKITADLNGDGVVDLYDALLSAKSFGAVPESQNWNEDADINGDGQVDIYDAIFLCGRFGRPA